MSKTLRVALLQERDHGSVGIADELPINAARALHAQVVAEDGAVKAQLAAQDVLQPLA